MKLLGRLSRLPLKKAPWLQGVRPLGGSRPVRNQRGRSRVAKRFLALEKLPERSLLQLLPSMLLLQHVKTPRCTQLRHTGTRRTEPFVHQGLL